MGRRTEEGKESRKQVEVKEKTRQMRLRKVKTWTTGTEKLRVGREVKGNVRELRGVAGQD